MLYHILPSLTEYSSIFNVFRYISFRAVGATGTALFLSFLLGPYIINHLKIMQYGATTVREDTPETHLKKIGTPSMGGLIILLTSVLSIILWANLANKFIWAGLLVLIGYGLVGFADDSKKIWRGSKGLSGKLRLFLEAIIALGAMLIISKSIPAEFANVLTFPFFKHLFLDLGYFYIILAVFIMVGTANAVNLTDGLDGLAIGPIMVVMAVFGVIAYLVGHAIYAEYLQLKFIAPSGELAVFAGAIIGSGLGFLWYNAPPARIFMGDTGSLALGGALGMVAVAVKHEIVLAIAGGLFVVEALSVIIQVYYYKLTKKRVFLMAPIHHHFEKKGWSEPTIVIRFWIITIILALIALSTLKLR